MTTTSNFILSFFLFLLGNFSLANSDFVGKYEGRIRSFFRWSNYKCYVTVAEHETTYSITVEGKKIKTLLSIDKYQSIELNELIEEKQSTKMRVTEGSRLNEGIGFKEALFSFREGVLSQVSLHEEYLIFFQRRKEICGQLKKVVSEPQIF